MTEPKWATWSCDKCEVKVALRANSKGEAKHWCKRQSGRYVPLQKETNDQTNPGGRDPARPRGGTGARTSNQDQPSGGYSHLPATSGGAPYRGVLIYNLNPATPDYDFGPGFYDDYHGSGLCRRGTIARAGGFGSYAGFLAWCDSIIAGD